VKKFWETFYIVAFSAPPNEDPPPQETL